MPGELSINWGNYLPGTMQHKISRPYTHNRSKVKLVTRHIHLAFYRLLLSWSGIILNCCRVNLGRQFDWARYEFNTFVLAHLNAMISVLLGTGKTIRYNFAWGNNIIKYLASSSKFRKESKQGIQDLEAALLWKNSPSQLL